MNRILMAELANLASRLDANGMRDHADLIDIAIFAAHNGNSEIALDIFEDMAGLSTKTAGMFDVFRDQSKLVNNLTSLLAERARNSLSFYSRETRKIVNALQKALGRIQLPNGQTALDGMGEHINSIDAALRGQEKDQNKALETARNASGEINAYVQDPAGYEEKKADQERAEEAEEAEKAEKKEDRARLDEIFREQEESREQVEEGHKREDEARGLSRELALKPSEEAEKQIADWLSQGFDEADVARDFEFKKTPIDIEQSVAVQQHRKIDKKMEEHAETVRAYLGMNPDVMEQVEAKGMTVDDYIAYNIAGQPGSVFTDEQVMSMMKQVPGLVEEEKVDVPEDQEPVATPEPAAPMETKEEFLERARKSETPVYPMKDVKDVKPQEPAAVEPQEPAAVPIGTYELELPPTPIISSHPELLKAFRPFFSKKGEEIKPSGEPPREYAKEELAYEIAALVEGRYTEVEPGTDPYESAEMLLNVLEGMPGKPLKYTEPAAEAADPAKDEAEEARKAEEAQKSVGVSQPEEDPGPGPGSQVPEPKPKPIADKPVAESVEKEDPEKWWIDKMQKEKAEKVRQTLGASRGTLLIPMPENW